MKEILLKTEGLSKSFSSGGALQHVLKNVDLELYKGDFTVIMGASGAFGNGYAVARKDHVQRKGYLGF